MKRRDFLKLAGTGAGLLFAGGASQCPLEEWLNGPCDPSAAGTVKHLLATASSDRFLIKVSFAERLDRPPRLRVDGELFWGYPSDTGWRFWAFDVSGLEPGRRYELELLSAGCGALDPWEFSTFPAPDAMPERFRVMIFTCAGGHDLHRLYVPIETRQRLLRRGLEFQPDAAVVVGDHVYWDLRSFPSAAFQGQSPVSIEFAGLFDREAKILGHENEDVLKLCVDGQLADLYGTMFRHVPVFFVRDDHDYFEDDRATDDLVTFPPDAFMKSLARATQRLYYPELLRDETVPRFDSFGRLAPDRNETFGALRYGRLAEMLLYDCKGFVSLGDDATVVPPDVEAWLLRRMAESNADHVVNVPSNPIGYSAGKYAEWYPDVVADGGLTDQIAKQGWQPGWLAQHDRLLGAASRRSGMATFLSGDIHSIAESRIVRSGSLDLSANPIVSLISGTPGCRYGWPSLARNTLAMAPTAIEAETVVPVEERNGFHLVDFEPGTVTIRHFHWDLKTDPVEAIDTLEPFHVSVYAR